MEYISEIFMQKLSNKLYIKNFEKFKLYQDECDFTLINSEWYETEKYDENYKM